MRRPEPASTNPTKARSRATSRAGAAAIAVLLPAALTAAAAGAGPASASAKPAAAHRKSCARRTLQRLSLRQKVGQLFLVGIDASPSAGQLRLLAHDHLGSVLLAHNSDAGVAATRERVDRLQDTATTHGVRLWVAADQEGGYVQHLKGPGFSDIPTALTQGRWSVRTLRSRARVWGGQLRDAGVNLDLAPVADTVSRRLGTDNPPIGYYYREYGHRPDVVSSHALAVRRGMKDAHVQTVAKHFPDLGRVRVNTDTHDGATDDTTSRHGHWAVQPFRDLVDDRVPLVMISSARYTRIDADHIGPVSTTIMRGMLRHDLGFRGTIASDSLTAAALSHVPKRVRALRFVRAGGDLALVGHAAAVGVMYRTLLHRARHHHHLHLVVNHAALHVLRSKNRQGLLPCSPSSTPRPAGS